MIHLSSVLRSMAKPGISFLLLLLFFFNRFALKKITKSLWLVVCNILKDKPNLIHFGIRLQHNKRGGGKKVKRCAYFPGALHIQCIMFK